MGHINQERRKSGSMSFYTYNEIYHRKSKVMSRTGFRSIVRICCQKQIKPPGGPLKSSQIKNNDNLGDFWTP